MFEKFTTQDAQNFRQRYLNTYGFFRQDGLKKLLVKISRIDQTVGFADKDGIEYSLNPDSTNDVGFEFLPPKSGWHNTTEGAWLVRRTATRQWQRGICDSNTRITTPYGKKAPVDFRKLSQLYEHTIPLSKALKQFNSKDKYDTGFLAVSEQFAISANGEVYLYDTPIGKYTSEQTLFKISLEDINLWKTEVSDAFRRSNLEVEIIQ